MEENYGPINDIQSILTKTFLWLFLGLLATGIISVVTYITGSAEAMFINGMYQILCIVELVVVIVFSLLFRKLSPTTVAVLYFVYAIINGISLAPIFYYFEITSIAIVFLVAACLFGTFAYLGAKSKIDLSKLGTILFAILIGCVVVSIVNLFIGSTMIDILLDWILIAVFFGITAYDIQKILRIAESNVLPTDKLHIYGAMEIYLDFINIFLRLLARFGKRRD